MKINDRSLLRAIAGADPERSVALAFDYVSAVDKAAVDLIMTFRFSQS